MSAAITSSAIAAHCRAPAAREIIIEVVDATGSTNADLMARLGIGADSDIGSGAGAGMAGLRTPTLRLALRQSAGRGRAGRAWVSDAAGLTFSLAWRFDLPLTALAGLPLAVGVAIADVLRAQGEHILLKWPNDLLRDGRKLGGILIEAASGGSLAADASWVVIGIGINMLAVQDADAPATPVVAPSTGLEIAALPATDRNLLMARLLDSLTAALTEFAHEGFAPFVVRWNAVHAHAGQLVTIVDRGSIQQRGRALGVDSFGRLLLQTAKGTVAILAGDVSLRPAQEGA